MIQEGLNNQYTQVSGGSTDQTAGDDTGGAQYTQVSGGSTYPGVK